MRSLIPLSSLSLSLSFTHTHTITHTLVWSLGVHSFSHYLTFTLIICSSTNQSSLALALNRRIISFLFLFPLSYFLFCMRMNRSKPPAIVDPLDSVSVSAFYFGNYVCCARQPHSREHSHICTLARSHTHSHSHTHTFTFMPIATALDQVKKVPLIPKIKFPGDTRNFDKYDEDENQLTVRSVCLHENEFVDF
jgi:hypothetical protein